MKNLAKLNGAKALSSKEQKSVNGGKASKGCSPENCANAYNLTAFEQLPISSFKCTNGICEFI